MRKGVPGFLLISYCSERGPVFPPSRFRGGRAPSAGRPLRLPVLFGRRGPLPFGRRGIGR
jgi:hypothetical protein